MNNYAYMTGYEAETLESFIKKLLQNKVTLLADVRENPISRKLGFSKTTLKNELGRNGIKYIHFRELGSPRPLRYTLRENGDYIYFFKNYRSYLKTKNNEIKSLVEFTDREHICIMCFERSHHLCHRTILADEILKNKPTLKIKQV